MGKGASRIIASPPEVPGVTGTITTLYAFAFRVDWYIYFSIFLSCVSGLLVYLSFYLSFLRFELTGTFIYLFVFLFFFLSLFRLSLNGNSI